VVLHQLTNEDNPDAGPPAAALLPCGAEPKRLTARLAGFGAPPAPGQAVIGSKIKLTFEATPVSGQKVPEWRDIS
jgi:hypothetical protein